MNNILYKKLNPFIILTISIISIVLLSTIAYAAINSTMKIMGLAYSRVEADVRITDFSIYEVGTNVISSYEEFTKDTITASIDFSSSSYVIYKIEVTNYGTTNAGITNITGLPSNLTYELIDYNLNEKLCDKYNKCNTIAVKTFYIKIIGSEDRSFTLNFEYSPMWTITYNNLTGTYQSDVVNNSTLTVDLSSESPKNIIIEEEFIDSYQYKNNILVVNNIKNNIEVTAINELVYEYDYTGSYQEFVVPHTGLYKIELWGAQGNDNYDSTTIGGKGGYTSGDIKLTKGEKFYIYVGQKGQPVGDGTTFNNGTANVMGWNGGGSTDIRTTSGTWNNQTSIASRIMVAAAGGTGFRSNKVVGSAGGLIGYSGKAVTGGTQISYGAPESSNYTASSFGIANGGCTSGNGYYPGGGAACESGSAGGSSYISGHTGCIAIASASSTAPRNDNSNNQCTSSTDNIVCSYHYSNYKFINTKMIDGLGYKWTTEKEEDVVGMPTYDGTSTMIGNEGNGHAKISYLSNLSSNMYTINYIDIDGDYPKTIYNDETLNISLPSTITEVVVTDENNKIINSTYNNNVLTLSNINKNIIITTKINYEKDLSGSNYNLIRVGATYTDKGLYFDGVNDYAYIEMFDWKNTTAFTIDFVAELHASSKPYLIFESSIDSNDNFGSFYIDSNEFGTNDIQLAMKYPGLDTNMERSINHQLADNVIDTTTSRHYTISSDSKKTYNNFIEMYKDGERLNNQSYGGYTVDYSNQVLNNYPFYIGSRAGTAHFTPMYLQEVRIYTKALTEEEIKQNNQGNIVTDNLVMYYKFY